MENENKNNQSVNNSANDNANNSDNSRSEIFSENKIINDQNASKRDKKKAEQDKYNKKKDILSKSEAYSYRVKPETVRRPYKGASMSVIFIGIILFVIVNGINIAVSDNVLYANQANNEFYLSSALRIFSFVLLGGSIVLAFLFGRRPYRVWKRAYKFAESSPEFSKEDVAKMNIPQYKTFFTWLFIIIKGLFIALIILISLAGIVFSSFAMVNKTSFQAELLTNPMSSFLSSKTALYNSTDIIADEPPAQIKENFSFTKKQNGEYYLYSVSKTDEKTTKHIFYVHGTGTTSELNLAHWNLAGFFATKMDADVYLPQYPTGSDVKKSEAVDVLKNAYKDIVKEYGSENVYCFAENSGADLMLLTLLSIQKDADKMTGELSSFMPKAISFVSPYFGTSRINDFDSNQIVVSKDTVAKSFSDAVSSDTDIKYNLGKLRGMPQINIFSSSNDPLLQETKLFDDKAASSNIPFKMENHYSLCSDWILMGSASAKNDKTSDSMSAQDGNPLLTLLLPETRQVLLEVVDIFNA